MPSRLVVAGADFNAKRPLPRRGTHHFRGKTLPNVLSQPESLQAGSGEDDRIQFSTFEPTEASVNVAAERRQPKIGTHRQQLSLPTQTTCSNGSIRRQVLK